MHLLPNSISFCFICSKLQLTGSFISLYILSVPASIFRIGLSMSCSALNTSCLTRFVEFERIVIFACGQNSFLISITSSTIPNISG